MTFIVGYSNAVCLSGNFHGEGSVGVDPDLVVTQSVAGVTGLYTNSAIAVINGNGSRYRFDVGIIMSVLIGACITSLLNPYPIAFELSPRYGPTFLIGGVLTTLGAIMDLHNSRMEFFFTAMGNGIMNGIASMYTANLIRVSHLTGTTTDIGLFLGQFLRGNRVNLWKLYILSGLAISFWIGSVTGYVASEYQRSYALIMNACFFYALGLSVIAYFATTHKELSVCDRLFGWSESYGAFGRFEKKKIAANRHHNNNEDRGSGDGGADKESLVSGNGDEPSSMVLFRVPERELMKIFDDLGGRDSNSDNNEGRVSRHRLMESLASTMLNSLFEERTGRHDGGGGGGGDNEPSTMIRRQDWRRQVIAHRESRRVRSSRRTANDGAFITATATDGSVMSSNERKHSVRSNTCALEAMEMLQCQSIREIELSGKYVLKEEEDEEEEDLEENDDMEAKRTT